MHRRPLITLLLTMAMPLGAATVRLVQGKASAPVNTVLSDGQTFATGVRSKSDVSLEKGFFRVGSDTGVQVVTSNNLSLEKGIMLAGSNPARFRRPAVSVAAPGYKMEVKGTAQIAYYPGHYVKITVLEGRVRVALQSLTGEWETLESGQMMIINPSDKRLPEPVEVDIGRLASTSQLIGGAFAELSTQGLIDAAAAAQGQSLGASQLAVTPFRLSGASPEVSLALSNRSAQNRVLPEEIAVFQAGDDLSNPAAVVRRADFADGVVQTSLGNVQIDRTGSQTQARANVWTVHLAGVGGAANLFGTVTADPAMFSGTPQELRFESPGDPLDVLPGADVSSPAGVALNLSGRGLAVDQASLQAGDGTTPGEALGLVALDAQDVSVSSSTLKGDTVSVSSAVSTSAGTASRTPLVTLDATTVSAQHGITVGPSSVRSDIVIRNTSQLASLVAGITVQSKGGTITVDTSTLQATKGTLTIDSANLAASGASGTITLRDATLAANAIRVRGTSSAGDALVIDGGSYSASLIKFYGSSTSAIRFVRDVTLDAPVAILASGTVEVAPMRTVTINGQGRIYTNDARYNNGTHGTINAAGGLTKQGFSSAPPF